MQDDNKLDSAKKHRMQSELMMKESDEKKNVLRKTNLEIETRQLKRKIETLSAELSMKEQELQKAESEQMVLQAEIKKIKKQLS